MSREFRTDKITFVTKEEAISFAKENSLAYHNLYLSKDKVYLVKKYTKIKTDEPVGRFFSENGKIKYFDYNNNYFATKKPGIRTGFKEIDGEKLKDYISKNNYNNNDLCKLLYRSSSFIKDAIRLNRMDNLCYDILCEHFNVPKDYFDPITLEEEESVKEEVKEFKCEQIHDDLIALIASNRRLEVLMQTMIDMWRND